MTRTDWTAARCLNHDPDLWFSDDEVDIAIAKAVCRSCPIQNACQERALVNEEDVGVWGALSAEDRATLLRRIRRKSAPSALCIEQGCDRFARILGMCQGHYKRNLARRPDTVAS